MWEMITSRINIKKNTDYDFRDIEVILTRNLPQNNQEMVDNWLKLRGLLSDKTVIEHLPYDLNAENELAEMDTQNEANMQKNLENMQQMGQRNKQYEVKDDGKVGDTDGTLGVSQSAAKETKTDVSESK